MNLTALQTVVQQTEEAVAIARAEVDAVLWDRRVRANAASLAARARHRGALASASLDGAVPDATVRAEMRSAGTAADQSPMGAALAATVRMYDEVPGLIAIGSTAPAQAWARLHAIYAPTPLQCAGRPRLDDDADDALHLGDLPPAAEVSARLAALSRTVATAQDVPAFVMSAVVHGELLWLRPFATGSAGVARAAARLVLASRGADPDNLTVPEVGFASAGRSAYVRAIRTYGTEPAQEGVFDWVRFCCEAYALGARAVWGELERLG